jgi:alpha-mannosidase
VQRRAPFEWVAKVAGTEMAAVIARRLHGREIFGWIVNGFRIEEREAIVQVGDEPDPEFLDVEQLVEEVSLATAEGEWTLRVVSEPKRTIVAAVPAPPLGWTSVRPVRVPGTVPGTCPNVDVSSLTRIVRGKDIGDSYNYAAPADDVLVDVPTDERIERVEDGPLRGVDVLHRTYVWDDRSVETQTRFEQRAGESLVRVRLELDNICDDQRVRVHVPLLEPAERSHAEGQFAVVERSLEVEGGHGEVAVATFPASGFVTAGGIALLLDHVTEYEVVGDELALTALRSIGYISVNRNPSREEPAGPEIPIPAAQLRGRRSFSFAYYPSVDSIIEHAEAYRHPFLTAPGTSHSTELRTHSGPALEGSPEVVLTALQPELARVVNESAEPQKVRFAGEELELRPWEIRTIPL